MNYDLYSLFIHILPVHNLLATICQITLIIVTKSWWGIFPGVPALMERSSRSFSVCCCTTSTSLDFPMPRSRSCRKVNLRLLCQRTPLLDPIPEGKYAMFWSPLLQQLSHQLFVIFRNLVFPINIFVICKFKDGTSRLRVFASPW